MFFFKEKNLFLLKTPKTTRIKKKTKKNRWVGVFKKTRVFLKPGYLSILFLWSKKDTSHHVSISIAINFKRKKHWSSTKSQIMTSFYLATRAAPSWYFRGGQNDCSLMLHLTIENVLKISGRGKCPVVLPWLRDLLSKLLSVILKQELQTHGISSNTVNKTMLIFANFFYSECSSYVNRTISPVFWHDYGQLTRIRTPHALSLSLWPFPSCPTISSATIAVCDVHLNWICSCVLQKGAPGSTLQCQLFPVFRIYVECL